MQKIRIIAPKESKDMIQETGEVKYPLPVNSSVKICAVPGINKNKSTPKMARINDFSMKAMIIKTSVKFNEIIFDIFWIPLTFFSAPMASVTPPIICARSVVMRKIKFTIRKITPFKIKKCATLTSRVTHRKMHVSVCKGCYTITILTFSGK